MLAKESAGPSFDLPEEVLEVLPEDPFEQLDVARKITSLALSTRVSALESETSVLRAHLTDRDAIIADLQAQLESLDTALSDAASNVTKAEREKESLLNENALLSNTVKKLNRDVTKLEGFKKALMQSLQDEEDTPGGASKAAATIEANLSSQSREDDGTPPSRTSSVQSQFSEMGSSNVEEHDTGATKPPRVEEHGTGATAKPPRVSQNLLLASQTSTPKFTPPGSPPVLSASASPTRKSKPTSPRRHSVSFATTRGMFDSSSPYSSMSGYEAGSQAGRTRVDGKEFFRQVRSRLSYEQFASFLANVKELNSHKQTKEETLQKAEEIFGPDNRDLYTIFEGLITRNVH